MNLTFEDGMQESMLQCLGGPTDDEGYGIDERRGQGHTRRDYQPGKIGTL